MVLCYTRHTFLEPTMLPGLPGVPVAPLKPISPFGMNSKMTSFSEMVKHHIKLLFFSYFSYRITFISLNP